MNDSTPRRTSLQVALSLAAALTLAAPLRAAQTTVHIFDNLGIQFGGDPAWHAQPGTTIQDNGRIVERTLALPPMGPFSRVTANLSVIAGSDAWDRAGSIMLSTTAGDVELHKFVTAFGGTTSHQQDISNLIPLLKRGNVKVKAFIDTWVPTARTIDFSVTVTDESPIRAPVWARPVFNDQDWGAGEFASNKRSISVVPPPGLGKVILSYLPSGHASDGSGGDEFTQRTHRIFIDGTQVWQGVPWRTNGRNFRSVNPTSGRWGDVWSSDFDRAGWIPGDDVDPILIDVTPYLTGGTNHTIDYQIDGIRPHDSSGYGYWRASSYLTGFAADAGPADFDVSAQVDGADLLIWQRSLGNGAQINNARGDANGNGIVDAGDLQMWQSAFGGTPARASYGAVPEPAGAALACCLWLSVAPSIRRCGARSRVGAA